MSAFKPAPPHNRMLGPALCVDCCRVVDGLRCTSTNGEGVRCGDYKRHRGLHSLIPCNAPDLPSSGWNLYGCADPRRRLRWATWATSW